MSKLVKIKGKLEEIIKVHGVWFYKKRRCECPCNKRIHYKESNKVHGVPHFMHGHNRKGEHHSEEANEKNRKAHIGKYVSLKTRKKLREINSGKNHHMWGKHPSLESRLKMSKAQSGEKSAWFGKHLSKKHKENLFKGRAIYYREHPNEISERIKLMNKSRKPHGTEIEQIIIKHIKTLTNKPIYEQVSIQCNNELYIVDVLVPYIKTIFEVNGCYWHYCVDCRPLVEDVFKAQEKRLYDIKRKTNLERMGFKVIVIWEHDIKNKAYKKILKRVINND